MSKTKKFRYILKTRSGVILVERIIEFGSFEHPFPEDWQSRSAVINQVQRQADDLISEFIDVEITEYEEEE
jgi:hypothetical protein